MPFGPKDHPNVIAPPPLIFLGMVAAGIIGDSYLPLNFGSPTLRLVLGVLVSAGGLALSARSVLELVRYKTHPDPRRPTTYLVTSGPYRRSRNPIYVAFGLMHVGAGIWTGKLWVLLGVIPALLIVRYGVIGPEERYLQRTFAERYEAYRQSVRRWL